MGGRVYNGLTDRRKSYVPWIKLIRPTFSHSKMSRTFDKLTQLNIYKES